MGEKKDVTAGGVIEELTPEEQKVLSKALKRIETDIYNNVMRRVGAFIGVALAILLIGGLVNVSSCSSNVENSASQKLASDPELRDKVVSRTEVKVQQRLEAAENIEKQTAQAIATSGDDIKQIRIMVDRILVELSRLDNSKNPARESQNDNTRALKEAQKK